ncbi:MAG: RsmB/NOP family class I SAM-dependent RNA methyltransferase [Alphaproteobacteria bacterium]|nr:RsmB/NOP family class I SAM-dependent RNA methyltransferase [Alphaproteobacteria bacterium]
MTNPRLTCAKIVQKIIEEKVFFGDLKSQISEKDLPFCNMLILTVLRHLMALKTILNSFLSKKIPHKHRLAEYLLLSAVAELLYMQTAEYAVINETVKTIRNTCDKFLGGMANAVLHKVSIQKIALRQKAEKILPLPDSFMDILQDYTPQQISKIAQSVLQIPPLDITVKDNPQMWAQKMNAEILPNGSLRLYNAPKVHTLPEYAAGKWWVQDVAASLPVKAMGDVRGKKILDLCAAPGGKTAQLLANGAIVTALDISAVRLSKLQQNMARLGFSDVQTIAIDALEYLQKTNKEYDAILLDAPCSATGTFRRHPEVLHIKNQTDVAEQAKLQKNLLSACEKALKIGGILIYSVCSISQTEGEHQIAQFIKENPHFKIVPITPDTIGLWQDALILSDGTVRTLPYYADTQKGMDSFFICKMQRII